MNKRELQSLEDTLLAEYKVHKQAGEFDVHAKGIARLFEVMWLVVHHLNKKPAKKKK